MKVMLQICLVLSLTCALALAQPQYKVIYDFTGPDGAYPLSLIFDDAGNLYGTTLFGGNSNTDCNSNACGTVFELSPNADGGWTQSVVYKFCSVGKNCADGYYPTNALIFDSVGNLYGSTSLGGAHGTGEIYELSPPSEQGGGWTETVLYSFCNVSACADGEGPVGALAIDAAGNLYGTTASGGKNFNNNLNGVVFEVSPPAVQGGAWTESVLYDFCSDTQGKACLDGFNPGGGVTMDNAGNLYGTTFEGGQYLPDCNDSKGEGCGTVFKLTPAAGGWTYTRLFAPPPTVGSSPGSPLVIGPGGGVYGTFRLNGPNNNGAVFEILHSGERGTVPLVVADGTDPAAALVLGDGVIYGSALGSGSDAPGTIFEMTASGQESVLYRFCSQTGCADGVAPFGLVKSTTGKLFGVAARGGTGGTCGGGCGVVYELKP
jgi:uncharacterized repeat protein (TIGR03803 family)